MCIRDRNRRDDVKINHMLSKSHRRAAVSALISYYLVKKKQTCTRLIIFLWCNLSFIIYKKLQLKFEQPESKNMKYQYCIMNILF